MIEIDKTDEKKLDEKKIKLLLATSKPIKIKGTDRGIWRRIWKEER